MTEHIELNSGTESVGISKYMDKSVQKALIYGLTVCESPHVYEWEFSIKNENSNYIFIGIAPSGTDFSKNIQ